MFRLIAVSVLLPCLFMLPASASADGAGAVSSTQTFHDVTQIYHAGVDPGTSPFPPAVRARAPRGPPAP